MIKIQKMIAISIKKFSYHQIKLFFMIKERLFRRFTPAGLVVLLTTSGAGIIGLDTHKTMGFQVFAYLCSLLGISILWTLFFKIRLGIKRSLPPFVTVNEKFRYRIHIQNLSRDNQRGLLISEKLYHPYPDMDSFLNSKEPGEEKRNFFDRMVSFYRWSWLYSKNKYATATDQPIPELVAGKENDIFYEIKPLRRGCLVFEGIIIKRPDIIGLINAIAWFPCRQSLVILPKRYQLPPFQLPSPRQYHLGGVSLASSVGDSEEFISLREYRYGDSLRRIHWKSWAKTGKPIVKEYQTEFFARHALILDTFLSEDHSDKFEEAVSLAVSFVCEIETQESFLDLIFVGLEVLTLTCGRGIGSSEKILETLACIQVCKDKSFSILTSAVLQRSSILSGCICILLSWDHQRQELITKLKELNIPSLVILIKDEQDIIRSDTILDTDTIRFWQVTVGKIQQDILQVSSIKG